MQYFVKRGQKIGGPFSPEQLKAGLDNGQLTLSDSFSSNREGPWKPLDQLAKSTQVPAPSSQHSSEEDEDDEDDFYANVANAKARPARQSTVAPKETDASIPLKYALPIGIGVSLVSLIVGAVFMALFSGTNSSNTAEATKPAAIAAVNDVQPANTKKENESDDVNGKESSAEVSKVQVVQDTTPVPTSDSHPVEDYPEDTNSVTSLTVEQAAFYVDNWVGPISFNSLTSLDKNVAQELAKEECGLRLNGLTTLDKDIAQELVKIRGSAQFNAMLGLEGLSRIDKDLFQVLAKFEEAGLSLSGLKKIDKDVAQEFAKLQVWEHLYLDGLTSITKDIAQEIVKWEGRNLHLNGLTSIDKDVAHELAKFRGSLELRGLTYLRDDVARELATWSPKEFPYQKGEIIGNIRRGNRSPKSRFLMELYNVKNSQDVNGILNAPRFAIPKFKIMSNEEIMEMRKELEAGKTIFRAPE